MLSYKVIGRHLRDARIRMKLSQQNVAEAADISVAYYGKIERGDIRPNLDRLEQVCNVLHISIQDVFRGASNIDDISNAPPRENGFIEFFEEISMRTDKNRRELIMQVSKDIADYKKI